MTVPSPAGAPGQKPRSRRYGLRDHALQPLIHRGPPEDPLLAGVQLGAAQSAFFRRFPDCAVRNLRIRGGLQRNQPGVSWGFRGAVIATHFGHGSAFLCTGRFSVVPRNVQSVACPGRPCSARSPNEPSCSVPFLPFANKKRADLLAHAPEGTCTQWRPALATRGRGAEELPPSGCPCTSLALATRGRGSWTPRRAVGPSCLALATRGRGAEELPPSGCP